MKREIEKYEALSIILGFLAALTGIFLIGFILGIVGITFGIISIRKYGKHPVPIIGIALSIVGILLALTMFASSGNDNIASDSTEAIEATQDLPSVETSTDTQSSEPTYTLRFGELLDTTITNLNERSILVIKAKITSSYDNDATVNQNYYNIEDLIKNQQCDSYNEIQYWAVADMSNGKEQKVVSFTVNSSLIQEILSGNVPINKLSNYVDDLFIHASLRDTSQNTTEKASEITEELVWIPESGHIPIVPYLKMPILISIIHHIHSL